MSDIEIDDKARAALGRLTAAEKECLYRKLRHQTAKEIAIDLGVSPHAVEKRLKMARAKLGLSSSVEAARLLVAAERYQQTGPQAAVLEIPAQRGNTRLSRSLTLGVIIMSAFAAILLAYAAQTSGVADTTESRSKVAGAADTPELLSASASPQQVEEYVKDFFARFDRDGSGFIERSEGPAQITLNCCGLPGSRTDGNGEVLTGEAAWQRFLSDNADNGDNRISFTEFRAARYERLLRDGIPVRREDVKIVGQRPPPYQDAPRGDHSVRNHSVEDLDYVAASPERVRAYVRQLFDTWDVDGSGFVELAEAPSVLITQPAKLGSDGKATLDLNDPGKRLEGDAARRRYIANADKDGDGKVSFEEFAEPVMPQFLRRGIPLIPADWKPTAPGGH